MDKKNIIGEITKRVETFGKKTFKENWRNESYYDGSGYELWADRIHPVPHPILLKTWASYNSLTAFSSGSQVTFRVSTPYIGYHQVGAPPQNAARPVLYDDPKIRKRVSLTIQEVLHQYFKGLKPNANRRR